MGQLNSLSMVEGERDPDGVIVAGGRFQTGRGASGSAGE
jgi:hypothetical protein